MYGAFIGDIVGSKYEFNNIKTKDFPLFSKGCDYTDDTIMTVAVAKAIMLSRQKRFEKSEKGRGFQEILVETMQDFGRRYPYPTGAYGGRFASWLRQADPKPYNSYGNGSAMRVSPCGLVAVTMEEAVALARASACVTHNHPEGVKGAEAVSAAIFLAKCGRSKEEIRQYISEHYYKLDFTLDSIRSSYKFDGSCQGSVPQAIVAFLESESFEDAIRNVISIGGDCDTTGAITGSIAWIYYAIQTGEDPGWVYNEFDPAMLEIKKQAMGYLPEEFVQIADEFHEACWKRAGTHERMGGCTSILSQEEEKKFWVDWEKTAAPKKEEAPSPVTEKIREAMTEFCKKYMVLMEVLYEDKELNQWCRKYSAHEKNTEHCELERIIYDGFMQEAYGLGFMPEILSWKPYAIYSLVEALKGTEADILHGICMEIRGDYNCKGSLIYSAIGEGRLYRLMCAFLSYGQRPKYTLEYVKAQKREPQAKTLGECWAWHDQSMRKWRLQIRLVEEQPWYLSVFVREDGSFEKYTLDKETAEDSHYEFTEEQKIRTALYQPGDEKLRFHEILIRYAKERGGNGLLNLIRPYITAQFHYDG